MEFWKLKALTYLSGIWLYRWYALGIAWLCCLLGWGVIAALPDQYKVEAKVYIDADSLMGPLLKGLTVNTDANQQVNIMLKTLITRPNLEQVIHITQPKSVSWTPAQLEKGVEAMEKKMYITYLGTKNYYAFGYIDNKSAYAESVAQTLLSILVDSNIGNKRRDLEGARSFIDSKVTEYEDRLREADKRRADFKTANLDVMGQKGGPTERLDTANSALMQAQREMETAVAKRDSLRAMLATTPPMVPITDPAVLATAAGRQAAGQAGAPPGSPQARLQAAKQGLADMLLKFTDSYPDVIALKKGIAQLETEVKDAKPAPSNQEDAKPQTVPGVSNPIYVELRKKFAEEEMNVAVQRQHLGAAAAELDRTKQLSSKAIDVLSKYSDLDRDYDNMAKTYQQLLTSRESANMSQALDTQTQNVLFRVIEPPQRTQYPTAPNRPLFNSLVLVAGILAGAAGALLLSITSGRFIVSGDISSQFDIPIIGVVTMLRNAADVRRARVSALALAASVALLVFCYAGVIAVLRTSIYTVVGV